MKDYVGDAITVHWNAERCIHVGTCTRTLPTAFDLTRRPWIDPDGATADDVAAVIERCPTGALSYTRGPERGPEVASSPTTVTPVAGGPLFVRGDLALELVPGEPPRRETRVALCRCGRSGNQPFCDNSHRAGGTNAPPARLSRDPAKPSDICTPQPSARGPVDTGA